MKLNTSIESVATIYMTVTSIGFMLILTGGTRLSRLIQLQFHKDIFNEMNETFGRKTFGK